MNRHAVTGIQVGVLAAIAVLVGVGLWQVHGGDPMLLSIEKRPANIMNTNCQVRAIVPANRQDVANRALDQAIESLRRTEDLLTAWRPNSDIGRLNDQKANMVVMLDPQTIDVLQMSMDLIKPTGYAFDVTYAPLFNLWRKAGKTGRMPTNEAIENALQACGRDSYRLHPDSVMKLHDGAKVDLGGIAKGYGIDLAVEVMRSAGVAGGLVEVGGDIRCFGAKPGGGKWRILIKNPFSRGNGNGLGVLRLSEGAICTSGDYERYVEIEGKRYSHIVDPFTHRPVASAPSVTVVAATAAEADAWATALSVVAGRAEGSSILAGPQAALDLLKDKKIEAMIVVGTKEAYKIHKTPGFDALLDK